MKFIVLKKNLWSIMIYIFLLLIGVTELRRVHVHMLSLSNKGEMVQAKRE